MEAAEAPNGASDQIEVECPSGLRGLIKPITIGDLNSLASNKNRKRGADPLGRLLAGVWSETLHAGYYKPEVARVDQGISNWVGVLLGDRAWLILESRRITWGDDFYFRVPCQACKKPIDWHIDLSELEISGLSDEAKQKLEEEGTDAVFYRTLPRNGAKVGFRLLLGLHQRNIIQAAEEGEDAKQMAGLLSRLAYIEGLSSSGERRRFINGLHVGDVEWLKEQWEEADIYVQDTTEIECQKCYNLQEIVIPIDERFFSARSAKPRIQPSVSED